MPKITIVDLAHVTVDGNVAGTVVDVLHNYGSVPGVKAALLAAHQQRESDREAAHAAKLEASTNLHARAIADERAAHEATKTAARDAATKATADQAAAVAAENAAGVDAVQKKVKEVTGKHAGEVATLRGHLAELHRRYVALGGDKAWAETLPGRQAAAKATLDAAQAAHDRLAAATPTPAPTPDAAATPEPTGTGAAQPAPNAGA